MTATVHIGGQEVRDYGRCFVIAEAGVNHNGDLDLAHKLVDVAADAGASAVKFQSFNTAKLVSPTARKARYQVENTADAGSQSEMLAALELAPEALAGLMAHAAERGVVFLSTPFDEESADVLDRLGVPAFKVSSGDLTTTPLLRHIARKGRPMLLSTGMAELAEVREAVDLVRSSGTRDVVLFQCTSSYPAPAEAANLRVMATFRAEFDAPVGYSDHTAGLATALASVALGAASIEKHFTLDRTLPGPDHLASLEPQSLKAMVDGIREIEAALGVAEKRPDAVELDTRDVARRSLFAREAIPAGAPIAAEQLIALRPGIGVPPREIDRIAGRRAARDIAAGAMLEPADFD